MQVVEVAAEATHDLRWRILRNRRARAPVVFPEDGRAGAFHVAVRDVDETGTGSGVVLAVASFIPEETSYRPGQAAVHLRGMAVDGPAQHHGLGRLLVTTVIERLRREGVAVLWCNARDSAMGFYSRLGFEVVGDGFVHPESGLAHHVMVHDL